MFKKYPFPPCNCSPVCLGTLGCVLWGRVSLQLVASGRLPEAGVYDERRGKMLSLHIGYRAWGYKEEENTQMKGLEVTWTQDICRMWVTASYRAQGHALLNFALNNTKLGCQKISARGHSSPSFLPRGVILPSHWCNGKLRVFGTAVCPSAAACPSAVVCPACLSESEFLQV